jgi:hypothetical protein
MSQKSGEALQEKHIQLHVQYIIMIFLKTKSRKKQKGSDQQCVKRTKMIAKNFSSRQFRNTSKYTTNKKYSRHFLRKTC